MTDHGHENPLQHVLHGILHELKDIRQTVDHIHHRQERLEMALNAQAQAIVDAVNASTNKIGAAVSAVGDAVKAASTAIADLAAKVAAGSIDPAELTAAIQPSLDALNSGGDTLTAAAAALTKTATDADPAITPGAPPIVVP